MCGACDRAAAREARKAARELLLSRGVDMEARMLEADGTPEAIVMATGSEVGLAVNAAKASGKAVRVVSMPCADRFLAQDQDYRDRILPPAVTRRLAIEAGVSDYWWRFVGLQGDVLGIDRYGESAPAGDVFKYFGFTVDNAVKRIEGLF